MLFDIRYDFKNITTKSFLRSLLNPDNPNSNTGKLPDDYISKNLDLCEILCANSSDSIKCWMAADRKFGKSYRRFHFIKSKISCLYIPKDIMESALKKTLQV